MNFFETDYNTLTKDGVTYPIEPRYAISSYRGSDRFEIYDYKEHETLLSISPSDVTENLLNEILEMYKFKENVHKTNKILYLGGITETTNWALVMHWVNADNLSDMWGDDWNDCPYECNAGEIYDDFVEFDDQIILNPGWIYEDLEKFGKYDSFSKQFQWRSQYDHYWSTDITMQELKENDYIYGRIVNTRNGDTVWCKLGQTTRNEFYNELREKGAIYGIKI